MKSRSRRYLNATRIEIDQSQNIVYFPELCVGKMKLMVRFSQRQIDSKFIEI